MKKPFFPENFEQKEIIFSKIVQKNPNLSNSIKRVIEGADDKSIPWSASTFVDANPFLK